MIPTCKSALDKIFSRFLSGLRATFFCPSDRCVSSFIDASKEHSMVKVLNVAEKNDAAKNIAHIMSRGACQKREGFSRYNKIYQFDYMLNNQKVQMVMTSVSGHLLNYEFVGSYRYWNAVTTDKLFEAPIEKKCSDNYLDIKRTLVRESQSARKLIIWTDGDREGENIGFEIIKVCQEVNPNIQVLRARFSEITNQSITNACRSLVQPDLKVSNAVDVRQELDLRIGAAFTRFQTMRLRKVFPQHLAEKLISYGSCQFPTLGFVVERYKQVSSFIPESFWKIRVTHRQEDALIEFSWKRVRLFSQSACFVIFEKCLENPNAKVVNIKSKHKSKWRPLPLDTVELEKLSSRKLRISAKETMQIAEKLYTSGFISYPRTETNMFPKELDLVNLIQMQLPSQEWGNFAQGVLNNGPNPRNGTKTDNAHPPIHPTKFTSNLSGNEKRIYEFIVRHFLACCSKDAQGEETIVDIEISEEQFSASGLMITERNYLDVYPYEKWNAKIIPVYSLGQIFTPTSVEMPEGETTPPPLLTEADLISLMEKYGIGTDATHAEHIEKIKSRMYVGVRDDGRFVPGELGMGLVEGYDLMGFEMSKPYLRAELESDLKRICEGVKDPKVVLSEQVQKYKHVFSQSIQQAKKLDEALSQYLGMPTSFTESEQENGQLQVVRPCYNCNMEMTLKKKRDGNSFYVGCCAYPQCKSSLWFPSYVIDVSVSESICQRCDPGPVHLLNFKCQPGSMRPYFPNEFTGCIGGCDNTLLESLGIFPSARTIRSGDTSDNSIFSTTRNGHGSSGSRSFSTDSGYNSHLNNSSMNSGRPSRNGSNFFTRASALGDNSSTSSNQSENVVNGRESSSFRTASSYIQNPSPGTSFPRNNNSSNSNTNFTNESSHTTRSSSSQNDNRIPATLVCQCGEDAILLTVRKAGKNQGRQFYKCVKQEGNCNFFEWADCQISDDGPNGVDGVTGQIKCKCHKVAVLRTVQNGGPNHGKTFYSCEKPFHQKCGFFQWADEGASNGNQQNNYVSKPKPSSSTKTKRKCSICRQEGHSKLKCPSL